MVRIEKGSILGAYNCMCEKQNRFLYKCHSQIEGYMLRKRAWVELTQDFEEIADILKENMRDHFLDNIKSKVEQQKVKLLNRFRLRGREKHIITVVDLDK